jgi:hypothetical protein
MDVIPPSTALQIAGRAGRYASQFGEGEVTTFKSDDLKLLNTLLNTPVEPVQVICSPPWATSSLLSAQTPAVLRLRKVTVPMGFRLSECEARQSSVLEYNDF